MLQRLFLSLQNVDWPRVRELTLRELILGIRSREWRWLCGGLTGAFLLASLVVMARPEQLTRDRHPLHTDNWLMGWSILTAMAFWWGLSAWSARRLNREARTGALTELWLTGCDVRELALVRTFSTIAFGALLACCLLPGAILGCAMFGQPVSSAFRFCLSLAVTGLVGAAFAPGSLHSPGRALGGLFGNLWTLVMISTGLSRILPGQLGWLIAVRRFAFQYNPLTAMLYSMGVQERRWPLALGVTNVILLFWLWRALRALAVQWTPEWVPAEEATRIRAVRICTRREWASLGYNPSSPRSPTGGVGPLLEWWECRTGVRVRFHPLTYLPIAMVLVISVSVALTYPSARSGQSTFAMFLWSGCLLAMLNAAVAAAAEREKERWTDFRLSELSADDWIAAKFKSALRSSTLPLWIAAAAILVAAVFPRGAGWSWPPWNLFALAIAPSTAAVLGVGIGLHSRDVEEATQRALWLGAGVPVLLSLVLSAGSVDWIAELLFPFVSAFGSRNQVETGAIPWLSLLVNGALGYGTWRLLRARWWDWALAEK